MSKDAAKRDEFEQLLEWLAPDRDVAGRIYEELRRDLIKIFGWNRCDDPEGMADETFDRVSGQAKKLNETFEGHPKAFFYAVANNQIREYHRRAKNQFALEGIDISEPGPDDREETAELREDCLHKCLRKLGDERRDQLLAYYCKDRADKIKHRAEMATRLGISVSSLRVRMCRLRANLAECIERCLDEASEQR